MSAIWSAFSRWYFNKLTSRLSKLGLQYHDVIADTGVHELAVSRLPAAAQIERTRRIKRAIDLSAKHEDIPVAARENPWATYKETQAVFSETQKEVDEKRHLAGRWWMPYHIGRETWHPYDTKQAWFWNAAKAAGKPAAPPRMH